MEKDDHFQILQGMERTKSSSASIQHVSERVYQHSLCIDNGDLYACVKNLSFHPGYPSIRRHSDRSQNSQYGSGKKEREPERIRKDADHALPMPRNWDCEDDRRCQKKDAREDSILYYGIGSIKQGWPIGHPLLLPQDYVVDVYLSVRLEAGSLHLANYLIRITV